MPEEGLRREISVDVVTTDNLRLTGDISAIRESLRKSAGREIHWTLLFSRDAPDRSSYTSIVWVYRDIFQVIRIAGRA